jgi:predicted lipid-binding transport protein (Tim44 family)
MSVSPPPTSAPPGWYPDPSGWGQRYWNGTAWTEQLAAYPAPSAQAEPKAPAEAKTGDWIGGVLLSLLMPLIGVIAGMIYIGMGGTKRNVGVMCVCLSLVGFSLWALITLGG